MSVHPKNMPRINDVFPRWDAQVRNNVGSDLNKGDVVILDWTADGIEASIVSLSTSFLLTSRIKAVVLAQPNSTKLLAGTIGMVRVQGFVSIGLATGIAVTAGDAVGLAASSNATSGTLATTAAVNAPGTNSTYIPVTAGAFLATTASSASAQTVSAFFDGTNCNSLYLKD